MRSRILVSLLAGTAGGFLGWLLQENLLHYEVTRDVLTGACLVVPPTHAQVFTLVCCVGGFIGLFLGAVDGIMAANPRRLLQGMIFGAVLGIVLGLIGINLGNVVYNLLGGTDRNPPNPSIFAFIHQVIARAFGWALMGLGLGVGSAIATRSPKRIWHGAIGGFLGGLLGGFVFDVISRNSLPVQQALGGGAGCQEVGGPGRAVGFTAIGGLTGFFIGLVDELLKQAWVKVLAGRNEGKDFILSRPMNILGRDERCDVPLYGDTGIAAQHAAIRAEGNRHVLIDANTPVGTVVNGQRVQPGGELLLRDGDMIQIGAQRILFREKATAAKFVHPPVDVPKSKQRVPVPGHLCPFCGAPIDASGACLCTLVGSRAMPAVTPPAGASALTPAGYGSGPGQSGYSAALVYGASPSAASGGDLAMPRLVGIEGPYTGQVFLLTSQNIMLGRDPDRDIVLSADTTVSRNHARIANEGGDIVVYDNGSSNGTYVNNLRVSMQVLAPGDIVQFGTSKFRYE